MEELNISKNSLSVFEKRYLRKFENGRFETPRELFVRVSNALAEVEYFYGETKDNVKKLSDQFFKMMTNFEFLPAGRTLTLAGIKDIISNCVVLHPYDNLEVIFETLKEAATLQQAGCGVGFPFDKLRPAGSITKRTFGESSGPVSFMFIYDVCFNVVKSKGRHGASISVMSVDHPDILEFISCKEKENSLKVFNISVAITKKFMDQVISDSKEPWECFFEINRDGRDIEKIKCKPRIIKRDDRFNIEKITEIDITAKQIWERIIKNAWKNGEPGVIFIDTVNESNPLPGLGRIQSCNPCGEQYLHDGDACNLGSINLSKFILNKPEIQKKIPPNYKKNNKLTLINWDRLGEVIDLAVQLLDNVIDLTKFPVQRVQNMFIKNRRMGLGIMGLADFFYGLKISYGSEESFSIMGEVMEFIQLNSHLCSMKLGKSKGVFENYEKSIYYEKKILMRNASITNIAPTGSTSLVADVCGGIEPYFALAYKKSNILNKTELIYFNESLIKCLVENKLDTKEIMDEILNRGSIQNIKGIPDWIKKIYVTSMDIKPEAHIKMQSVCQKYCDNAISKTINMPFESTTEDVSKAFMLMYQSKCKGGTVYRNNSRDEQVLNLLKEKPFKESCKNDQCDV
jgi:ribonucleoside-diphosphate reductase alpha chain